MQCLWSLSQVAWPPSSYQSQDGRHQKSQSRQDGHRPQEEGWSMLHVRCPIHADARNSLRSSRAVMLLPTLTHTPPSVPTLLAAPLIAFLRASCTALLHHCHVPTPPAWLVTTTPTSPRNTCSTMSRLLSLRTNPPLCQLSLSVSLRQLPRSMACTKITPTLTLITAT